MANPGTLQQPTPPAHPAKGAPQLVIPFTRAAREHIEPGGLDKTVALTTSQVALGSEDVVAFGYARALVLMVEATGGAGGNAVAAQDAPWSVLHEVLLSDVNGAALVQVSGYELYLVHKYGGGSFNPDPKNSPFFSAPSTNGNFSFLLRIPMEIVAREGIGALENMSSASTYKLRITVAAAANVFTTSPTTLPQVRVRSHLEAWTPPAATDLRNIAQQQQPDGLGTAQFWTRNVKSVSLGQNTIPISRLGNLIRNLVFVFRGANGLRSDANFPDPFQLIYDGHVLQTVPRSLQKHYMAERYGFDAAALDVGVFVLDYTHEIDGHPGGEQMDLYLPTTQGTRLELSGQFGDSGAVTILTNDVNPGAGVAL